MCLHIYIHTFKLEIKQVAVFQSRKLKEKHIAFGLHCELFVVVYYQNLAKPYAYVKTYTERDVLEPREQKHARQRFADILVAAHYRPLHTS